MGQYRTLKLGVLGVMMLGSSVTVNSAVVPEKVVFGYSMDGWPVSSSHWVQGETAGIGAGFCADLWDYLEENGYSLDWKELRFDTRFVAFAEGLHGRAGIECGPTSRTPEREALLQPADGRFKGVFSQPFAVTPTKLLLRNTKLETFYTNPASIRIGVLQASGDVSLPVTTTSLLAKVFPTAQIKPLASRREAVERLLEPVEAENALDAYASDEILLNGILMNPAEIPQEVRDQYTIEPPFGGFSREEYAIIVYNNPALLEKVNVWLTLPTSLAAAANLQPEMDTFTRLLVWLNRTDHLVKARLSLTVIALLGAISILLFMGRSRLRVKSLRAQTSEEPSAVPAETNTLTPQQLRVARLWANGHQAGMIAKMLDIGSSRTVESHVRTIYQKTATTNRTELLKNLQERDLL